MNWDREYRLVDPEIERSGGKEDKDYGAAAAELKKAVVTGIPDDEMYYRLGFCYEKMGDYDRALDAYLHAKKFAQAGTGNGRVESSLLSHLGTVYARKKMFREAADNFEKAAAVGDDSAALRNNIGYCYRMLSLRRKALDEFKAASLLDPASAEIFLNMGITYAELGDLTRAEEALRKALRVYPDMEDAKDSLAMVLRAGGGDGAVASDRVAAGEMRTPGAGIYRQADAESPPEEDSIAPELDRAGIFMEGDDFTAAERVFRGIIAGYPDCGKAYLGLARCKEYAGKRHFGRGFPAEESIAYYRKALEIDPGSTAALFGLGNVYLQCGRYSEAAEALEAAVKFDPGMLYAAYDLGLCYGELGENDKAEDQFREAVRLDPNFVEARSMLGKLYMERRNYGGAIEQFERVLGLKPDDAEAHYNLGMIFMRNADKPRAAIEQFKAYLRCKPDADDARRVNGWIRDIERQEAGGINLAD